MNKHSVHSEVPLKRFHQLFVIAAIGGMISFGAGVAHATHSWGSYHWARTSNPFTVKLGTNVTSQWTSFVNNSAPDWSVTSGSCNNAANPVRATVVAGSSASRKCTMVTGTVQMCNNTYGNNGWLGIASINIDANNHITKGSVKLNDTYFNTAQYNTPAWRAFVTEQEVGHTLGLDHQDAIFDNPKLLDGCGRGTCMDYTNDPTNQGTPNQHDYDQLVTIYNHTDSYTTLAAGLPLTSASAVDVDNENQAEWGRAVGFLRGKANQFERDLGNGHKLLTFVLWTE